MKILIYGINYLPELTGIGKYTGEMAEWLTQHGHTVDVITGHPYYPEWAIHEGYSNRGWLTENRKGVRVMRCPLYVPVNVTSLKRIVHEFSFVAASSVYWLRALLRSRYDVVLCLSPPFHLGILPLVYSKLVGVPLWIHIQDLQIDMAKDLGMLTNTRFLNLMFRVERFILKHSAVVSTISKGMIRKIKSKKVVQGDCLLFPNWVDDQHIRVLPKEASLRAEFGIPMDDQVVLYSGSLGEKQGLELIIDVAKSFSADQKVHFLIVGSGGGKARLEELVAKAALTNVRFYPLQPYEKLAALLATADVHLVLQKKSASDLVLPSKLTGILSSGGFAIVSAVPGTTLYEVMHTHKMGMLIEPESAEALRDGLYKALTSDLSVYRRNARHYAEMHLSKDAILTQLNKDLHRIILGRSEQELTTATQ